MNQFTANDSYNHMTGLSPEQAVHWARLANQKLAGYSKKYPGTSPLVLRERVIKETSEELQRLWN